VLDESVGNGPFGAMSIGEPPLVPVAAAIANAVHDAIGVRIYDLPITAEKVLAGIIDTRGRKSEVGSRKEGARSRDQSAKKQGAEAEELADELRLVARLDN
jgi:hypothetical protein